MYVIKGSRKKSSSISGQATNRVEDEEVKAGTLRKKNYFEHSLTKNKFRWPLSSRGGES